jgi:hypothetical protein
MHDELGEPGFAAFASNWLSAVDRALARHLGRREHDAIDVVLSPAALHAERFPRSRDALVDVLDEGTALEADQDREATLAAYPPSTYALGVATRVRVAHRPPELAVQGRQAIYVDVETVVEVSQRLRVDPEALLAQVLAHELSHCYRGHGEELPATPIHGWLAEGDAQRDAWYVLTELLGDPEWMSMVRAGRAAQARLALEQPPAYRHFPITASEQHALTACEPMPDRQSWVVRPARKVFRLVHYGQVEVPASVARGVQPRTGDFVYLQDDAMIAGPWIPQAATDHTRIRHREDMRAASQLYRKPVWLQLRPSARMVASPVDELPAASSELLDVSAADREMTSKLLRPADQLAQELAEADRVQTIGWILDESGHPRTAAAATYVARYDPYDDW